VLLYFSGNGVTQELRIALKAALSSDPFSSYNCLTKNGWTMAKSSNLPSLDLGEAFVHFINEHRWLGASACSWKLIGPKATRTRLKIEAHELVPNIDVMALDFVLLHARALIDFRKWSRLLLCVKHRLWMLGGL
jgi:hypothetical protein